VCACMCMREPEGLHGEEEHYLLNVSCEPKVATRCLRAIIDFGLYYQVHHLTMSMQCGSQVTHAVLVEVPSAPVQQAEAAALLLSKISPDAKLVIIPADLIPMA
jgi:hypothetical protein